MGRRSDIKKHKELYIFRYAMDQRIQKSNTKKEDEQCYEKNIVLRARY